MTPLERARNGMLLAITQIERDVRLRDLTDDEMKDIARAVLTAIREPSEEMLVAGITAPNYLEDQSSRRGCGNIYAAMIDAALAEQ